MKPRAALIRLVLGALLVLGPNVARAAEIKPPKVKRNQAYVAPDFASYGVITIGMAPVSSFDQVAENEKLFRQAVESGFGNMDGYKFQAMSYFIDEVRKGGVTTQLAAIEKAGLAGLPSDTAAVDAVALKTNVQAVLFSRLTTWQRLVVDPNTRGQSFTQVGAEFALVSLKDGVVLWRGSFQEKGDGPYNDPNAGEVTERDATGNSVAKQAQLEPPSFIEELEKLISRVSATLPKAPAPAAKPAH